MKKLFVIAALGLAVVPSAFADAKGEFDGLCAYGLTKGMDVKTDCSINWTDPSTSRKYCFSSAAAKSSWSADTRGNLGRAEASYRALAMKAQAKALAATQMNQAQGQMDAAQAALKDAQGQAQGGAEAAKLKEAQDQMNAAQGMLNGAKAQVGAATTNPAGTAVNVGVGMVGGSGAK